MNLYLSEDEDDLREDQAEGTLLDEPADDDEADEVADEDEDETEAEAEAEAKIRAGTLTGAAMTAADSVALTAFLKGLTTFWATRLQNP